MSFTTMTIGELCVSPYNARENSHDANAVEGMAESLLSRGQLYPLVVHPMTAAKGKRKKWGALAGGRRFRAFTMLIDQGRLPRDHPIDVIVRDITDEGELRELSLAENLVRVDLRPYEVYAAVARAHDRGRSLKEIADTNGQTIETIRRWARLGNLHPDVFAALEQGHISQDQAKAFAATEDQVLQLEVFRQLFHQVGAGLPTDARGIRRMLKIGDREQHKLLLFVGEDAYAKAGGRFELDLFADDAEQRGRVVDEALLMHLSHARLEEKREQLRRQAARPLRFEHDYPRDKEFGGVARDLEIYAEPRPASDEDARRLSILKDVMSAIEEEVEELLDDPAWEGEARTRRIAEIDVEYVPMEQEVAAIGDRMLIDLPEGDVFGTLVIEPDGDLEIRWWWGSRKAKRGADKASLAKPVSAGPVAKPEADAAVRALTPKPAPGGAAIDNSYGYAERQKADVAIKDEFGLTADGVQVMRALRREALRCGLLDDAEQGGDFGRDYAVWCLLRFELGNEYGHQLGARRLDRGYHSQAGTSQVVEPHVKRSIAGMRWEKERAQLRDHSSLILKDLPTAFNAFHNETSVWKDKAAAFLAGLMLERSLNAPGYQVPLHDLLAAGVGLRDADLRTYAEPTEELIDLLPKAQRLALAKPHVSSAEYTGLEKLKAADLTAPITRALRKAKHWVHPLVRFLPSPAPAQPADEAGVLA